jgi:hypothetical protein
MAQKTAVEWLQEKYNSRQVYEESIFDEEFEQAKAMEKEQIIQSYYAAVVDTEMIHEHKKFIYEGPEQYYNETYNK